MVSEALSIHKSLSLHSEPLIPYTRNRPDCDLLLSFAAGRAHGHGAGRDAVAADDGGAAAGLECVQG